MAEITVVFADLTGSLGLFEAPGNVKATQVSAEEGYVLSRRPAVAHDARSV